MLKSCSRCGRIHARGDPCPVKCAKVVEKRNKEIVRFRNRQVWKRMREHIKERDKFLCVYCLKKLQVLNAEELSVHNIVPLEENFDLALEEENLITLCREHHEQAEKGVLNRAELKMMIYDSPRGVETLK